MKETRIYIITTICAIIAIFICGLVLPVYAEVGDRGEFYPKLAVVVSSERVGEAFEITCVDRDGNEWGFWDYEEEWIPGDIVNLLMWHLGEREEDDELVEVYFEGYTDNIDEFFRVIEWR